ncbi:putative protein C4orf17, partial [Galemys pyrenaicus]
KLPGDGRPESPGPRGPCSRREGAWGGGGCARRGRRPGDAAAGAPSGMAVPRAALPGPSSVSVSPPAGLNNIPICTVNDDGDAPGARWGAGRLGRSERRDTPPARGSPPRSAGRRGTPAPRAGGTPPRPRSEPWRRARECFRTSSENPLLLSEGDAKAGRAESPPRACSTAASCGSEARAARPDAAEDSVRIPNYLHHEIKILAKLCDMLRTDSLADVLQWLLHASSKEKEWVSALIHTELAEINLLTRGCQRKNTSAEPGAGSGKPLPVKSPPNSPARSKVPTRCKEGPQLTRVSSQGSEENKDVPKEAEHKPPLFIRRSKMTIPMAEYLSKPKSSSRPRTQENISTKSATARSTQGRTLSPQRASCPLTYQS